MIKNWQMSSKNWPHSNAT